jgi:hypothetical protein
MPDDEHHPSQNKVRRRRDLSDDLQVFFGRILKQPGIPFGRPN